MIFVSSSRKIKYWLVFVDLQVETRWGWPAEDYTQDVMHKVGGEILWLWLYLNSIIVITAVHISSPTFPKKKKEKKQSKGMIESTNLLY